MTTIYVKPSGNNANSGLSDALAVQTFAQGVVRARAIMSSVSDDVEIALAGGDVHNITASTIFSDADNRSDGRRLRITSYGTGRAIVTARTRITGWVDAGSGLVYAPFSGATRDLWSDGATLERATLGRFNTFYRVFQWEQSTKTVLISSSLVPAVAQWQGLEMVIQMGWSISHLPVVSIVPSGIPNLHRVTFATKAATAEFAKGDLSDPGLGSAFAIGPYHNDLGQRFWWQGSPEFCVDPGTWGYDPVANRLWARLPVGVSSASAFEALGVYVPNGSGFLETMSFADGQDYDTPPMLENLDITNLEFRNFGTVPVDPEEGYIGYINGASIFDNAGAMGFRILNKVIELRNVRSVRVTENKFTEMSAIPIMGQHSIKGARIDRNVIRRVEAGGILIYGVATGTFGGSPFTFDATPTNAQNQDIHITNNALADGGLTLLGGAIFGGAGVDVFIDHNTVRRWTDNGIETSNGARHYGLWVRNNRISRNDIDTVLTVKVDGGAIYSSGNIAGFVASTPPLINDGARSLKVWGNRVRNVRASGYDPGGGFAAAVYQDLGSQASCIFANDIASVDVVFKTNSAGYCSFVDNKIADYIALGNHSFAGANIYPPNSDTPFLVLPPQNNPPNADDLARFFGTGGYFSFQAIFPFPTPQSVISTTGVYNTLSRVERNSSSEAVDVTGAGAPAELVAQI